MLETLYVRAYKFYEFYVHESFGHIRGVTRLGMILAKIVYWLNLKKVEEGFRYNYKGTDIVLSQKEQFEEILLGSDTIKGYTKNRELKETDTVIDAGAYPGEFTIYAAKKAKKVIALEPDSKNLNRLRKNIGLNGLDNVDIVPKVLWSNEEEVCFNSKGELDSSISKDSESMIESTTLDSLAENKDIDFVKMDVEGAEIEALKGAQQLLQEGTYFSVASYHKLDGERTFRILEDLFDKAGYRCETGFEEHLTTWAWKN